jgi:hypothetical protein
LLAVIVFVIYPSALHLSRALAMDGFQKQMELRFAWLSLWGGMVIASAWGSAMVGLLPVFQTSITRLKRIVLLAVCLLPVAFTLLNSRAASSELRWDVVGIMITFSVPGWVINGPAILAGQPFLRVIWRVMRALRLTSSDYAER